MLRHVVHWPPHSLTQGGLRMSHPDNKNRGGRVCAWLSLFKSILPRGKRVRGPHSLERWESHLLDIYSIGRGYALNVQDGKTSSNGIPLKWLQYLLGEAADLLVDGFQVCTVKWIIRLFSHFVRFMHRESSCIYTVNVYTDTALLHRARCNKKYAFLFNPAPYIWQCNVLRQQTLRGAVWTEP